MNSYAYTYLEPEYEVDVMSAFSSYILKNNVVNYRNKLAKRTLNNTLRRTWKV